MRTVRVIVVIVASWALAGATCRAHAQREAQRYQDALDKVLSVPPDASKWRMP